MKLLVRQRNRLSFFFFFFFWLIIGEIDVRITLNELPCDSLNRAYTTYIVLVILQTAHRWIKMFRTP